MAAPNINSRPSGSSVAKQGQVANKTLQPDWSITNDGRGILESSVRFYYENRPDSFPASLPKKGDQHPSNGSLKCYKVSYAQSKNEFGYATAEYIGLENGNQSEGEWEVTSSTSETSIIFHPDFEALAIEEKGSVGSSGNAGKATVWKNYIKVDEKNEFEAFTIDAPDDLAGIESYLTPQTVCRVTFSTTNASIVGTVMGGLGKTAGTPYGCNAVPQGGEGGGNWLLTNASCNEYGNIYRIQTEWTLSTRGKPWNEKIYKEFGG